jgi:hypothetical protein
MGSAVGSAYSRRERLAQRAMEAGFDVPGFKLVRGRSVRKFREDMNEPKLVAAILKGGFVKDKAKLYTKPELISGPQAEKLLCPLSTDRTTNSLPLADRVCLQLSAQSRR